MCIMCMCLYQFMPHLYRFPHSPQGSIEFLDARDTDSHEWILGKESGSSARKAELFTIPPTPCLSHEHMTFLYSFASLILTALLCISDIKDHTNRAPSKSVCVI